MKIFAKDELSKIKKTVFPTILLLFINLSLSASDIHKNSESQLKRSLELSLLIPGAGQLKEKKYLKGFLFLSGELYSLVSAITNNIKGNSSYLKYRNSKTTEDAVTFRKEVEKFDRLRNIYILSGIGIWVLNIFDIHIYVKKKRKVKISLKNGKNQTIIFGLNYSF